jgi:hypothetical protein
MPGEMAGKPATSERLGPIVDQLLPHELMLSPIADENSICVLLHTSTVTVVPGMLCTGVWEGTLLGQR